MGHLGAQEHRKGHAGAEADLGRGRHARKIRLDGHVANPGRSPVGSHPAGQANPPRESRTLGERAKVLEPLRIREVPDPGGDQGILAAGGRYVHVAHRPGGGLADVLHSESERRLRRFGFVGGFRDLLQQAHELRLGVELAGDALGDRLGLEAGPALALRPTAQPLELGGVVSRHGVGHVAGRSAMRNSQRASPRCMQRVCSMAPASR